MSLDLYATALVWYGNGPGVAKLHGKQVQLEAPPDLGGLRVVMTDYRPEIGERRIQRYNGPASDMTADEVAAADAFLLRACAG
jgi:hypothetical protein